MRLRRTDGFFSNRGRGEKGVVDTRASVKREGERARGRRNFRFRPFLLGSNAAMRESMSSIAAASVLLKE